MNYLLQRNLNYLLQRILNYLLQRNLNYLLQRILNHLLQRTLNYLLQRTHNHGLRRMAGVSPLLWHRSFNLQEHLKKKLHYKIKFVSSLSQVALTWRVWCVSSASTHSFNLKVNLKKKLYYKTNQKKNSYLCSHKLRWRSVAGVLPLLWYWSVNLQVNVKKKLHKHT